MKLQTTAFVEHKTAAGTELDPAGAEQAAFVVPGASCTCYGSCCSSCCCCSINL
jgi:hypothetical protein